MNKAIVFVATTGLLCAGCGETPARTGVLVARLNVTKSRIGPSPSGINTRDLLPGTLIRIKKADVLGDDAVETIAALPAGAGVEIRNQADEPLESISTPNYLTDFGAVPHEGGAKSDLVLYTYPDAKGGGTFVIMTAGRQELARWQEPAAPGRFDVATWMGRSAIFYLLNDTLVVRSPRGEAVAHLDAPEGRTFRDVHVLELPGPKTVVVASGNAYTPYHMIGVYDPSGQLVFQEVDRERAFEVTAEGPSTFVVSTSTTEWRYALQPP